MFLRGMLILAKLLGRKIIKIFEFNKAKVHLSPANGGELQTKKTCQES